MPDEQVLVRYRFSRQDAADLGRLYRRPDLRFVACYLAAVAVVAAVLLVVGGGPIVAVVFAGVAAVILGFMIFRSVRGRHRLVGREVVLHLSSDGVGYEMDDASGAWTWRATTVHREHGLVALRQDGALVFVVPERVLDAADLEAIERWSREAAESSRAEGAAAGAPADTVAETGDGGLVVTGTLTPSRARAGQSGFVRPSVRRAGTALVLVVLGVAWATSVPGLLAGEGVDRSVLLLTAAGALSGVAALIAHLQGTRLARRLGGRPVQWAYDADGVTVSHESGSASVPWSRVRTGMVQGDVLVLRLRDHTQHLICLVAPLSAEQRRRVLGWIEAASGRRVHAAG